jgi:hypothetical protein
MECLMKDTCYIKNSIRAALFFVVALLLMSQGAQADEADYSAVFYSTSAHWDESQKEWVVPIRGYVYSKKIRSPIAWIFSWIGNSYAWLEKREDLQEIEVGESDSDDLEGIADSALLRERLRPFLLKGKGKHKMLLSLGDRHWLLDPSNKYGYISMTLRLGFNDVPAPSDKIERIFYEVSSLEKSKEIYKGTIYLVPPQGTSVVSDIDDTIKYSEVLDREELLENTLLYSYSSIKGMADWYQVFEKCGAAFHYVSKSPWQLYAPLTSFVEKEGFPPGSFYLRSQKTISLSTLLKTKGPSKKDFIRELLQRFPKRQFILVGDSTQKDPEIYADLAKEFPGQITHIYIRDVKRGDVYSTEFLQVFANLEKSLWTVFKDPNELTREGC